MVVVGMTMMMVEDTVPVYSRRKDQAECSPEKKKKRMQGFLCLGQGQQISSVKS